MSYFMLNRIKFGALTAFATLITYLFVSQLESRLIATARITGVALFFLMLALTLFNGRKKLPFLPIGSAAAWLRFHSFAGLFSMVLFLAHTGFRWPKGGLELSVFLIFWLVALSGVLGLAISRLFPRRLNQAGKPVIYENIPELRLELIERSKRLVLQALEKTKMSTLADFYAFRLERFFSRPRNFWSHLLGLQFHMATIRTSINSVRRYLNAEEALVLDELERLTKEKDELDLQYALQRTLKIWLFVHIPLTYSLIVFAAVHGIIAWSLAGA